MKRLALKTIEYTAVCLTVSLMFSVAEVFVMLAGDELGRAMRNERN